jgi:hypothetical protein
VTEMPFAKDNHVIVPVAVNALVNLFERIKAFDKELSRLRLARPSGVNEYLLEPELVARGINNFSSSNPSIVAKTQLPRFEQSELMAWPPPPPPPSFAIFEPPYFDPSAFERRAAKKEREQQRAIIEAELGKAEADAEFARTNNVPHQVWAKEHEERLARLRATLATLPVEEAAPDFSRLTEQELMERALAEEARANARHRQRGAGQSPA